LSNFFLSDEPKAETEVVSEDKEIKVAGYLNLAADAFHNFTDGNSYFFSEFFDEIF
jgi:hypothetical protein